MKIIIDVKVSDLKRAIDFYTKVLGLECRREEQDWAAIVAGDAEIHLYLHAGITHGLEFYVDDLDQKVQELKEKGIEFFSDPNMENFISADDNNITTFPWGRNAFFKDSEGNQLSLVKDFEK